MANFIGGHKIVEVGKLHGLLSGHMVAQAPYNQVDEEEYLDNGAILFLDKAAELVLGNDADAILKQPFLHYTEELMNGIFNGLEYFTVELEDGVCYPRAIALYEGDEFVTNNIAGTIPAAGAKKFAWLVDGVLTIADAVPAEAYEGPLFVVEKDVLPAGEAAAKLTLIDRHFVVVEEA